jgi:hypothetical protein
MKLLWLFGGIGFLFLLVATVWLAILNWSERIWFPIITAVSVGLVSAFISLAATLKETTTKDTFITTALVNTNGFPPMVIANNSPDLNYLTAAAKLIAYNRFINKQTGNIPNLFDETLRAEQYYLTRLVSQIQSGGWSVANVEGKTSAKLNEESPLKNPASLSLEKLSVLFKDTPFWKDPMENLWWTVPRFKLPKDTEVFLFHVPSSPETGVEKRGIRFQKKNYFTYEIQLEPITSIEGMPRGVELLGDGQATPTSVFIRVQISARFERMTSENKQTQSNKEWASWLTSRLKMHLSSE